MEYKKFMQKAKDDYQMQLVSQISDLFLKNGIEAMKMTDIAKELDIGVATLYRYFKTKKNLVILCAITLWNREIALFEGVFDNDVYHQKSGIEQVGDLLKIFKILNQGHAPFLTFLYNFDSFVQNEKLTPSDLCEYEASVMDVYPLFKSAYLKGLQDHTINQQIDFDELYFTVNHTMMSLSQKLLPQSNILLSDKSVEASIQIDLMIRMIIYYLKGE